MAKDLVRTRKYISKFHQMRSQLQAVKLKLQVRGGDRAATAAGLPLTRPLPGTDV